MGKEGGPAQAVQQGNDLSSILHSTVTDIRAYVTKVDSPYPQLGTLT